MATTALDFKLEGLDDVLKALRKAEEKEIRKAVYDRGKKVAKKVLNEAKANSPMDKDASMDKGNLKDSIKNSNSKKKLVFSVYVSDKKAPYGISVEYGHRTVDGKDVPAQPFVIPAGRKYEDEFEEEMKKALLEVASEVVE
jgi:HK97 gp10 family phage protein